MNYLPLIVGTYPDDNILYAFLSCNLSFPSLIPVTNLIMLTNNGPVLRESMCNCSIENYTWHQTFWKIITLKIRFNLTLMCTIPYSSVVINMGNCCIYLPLHSTDHVVLRTSPITWLPYQAHNWDDSLYMERKQGFTKPCNLVGIQMECPLWLFSS